MRKLFLLFSLLAFTGSGLLAQPIPKAKPKAVGMDRQHLSLVDNVINQSVADGEIPGAVLAVVRRGKIAYLKSYGNKQVYPHIEPMTTNTVFDMASVSKSISTAISTMILIERGQLRLYDNVSRYVPGFQAWTDTINHKKREIKVIDLLTHTSGLPSYAPINELREKYTTPNPQGLMDYISNVQRQIEPGTKFNYSCLNFITLQHIIENISEKSLQDFALQNIYKPLGMKHTDYNPTGETLDWTAPTSRMEDNSLLVGKVHDPLARIMNGGISGNAGVFSNAEDISILVSMLMNNGAYKKVRILSPLTIQIMRSVPKEYEKFGRTLGWDIYSDYASNKGDLFGANTYGHTGYTGTSVIIDTDTETAVILLTNRVHPDDKGSIVRLRALVANIVAGSIIEP